MVKRRLPGNRDIIPVYAVIAFLLFGWSFVLFAWKLPSWLNFMSPAYLFAVFAYSAAAVFLESLLFLLALLGITLILPGTWLKEAFIIRGSLVSFSVLGLMLLRVYLGTTGINVLESPAILAGAAVLLSAALAVLSQRSGPFRGAVAWLADRLIVFLYLLIPISFISLVTVLIRNVA